MTVTEEFELAIRRLESWEKAPVPASLEMAMVAEARTNSQTARDMVGIIVLSSDTTIAALIPFLHRGIDILSTSNGKALSAVERELVLARAINQTDNR